MLFMYLFRCTILTAQLLIMGTATAGASIVMLIMLTLCDIINLSMPFLQVYQHHLQVSHLSVSDLKMKAK